MTTALRNRAAPNAPRFLAGPGMAWLLWRQHRLQVALAAVAVALFAIPVTITGNRLWSSYTSCRASDTCSGSGLFQHYNAMVTIVDITGWPARPP